MGKTRRSPGSWRYQVIKGYKRRAQKFREEAQTVEEKMAWLKVIKWFETILSHRQMSDNDAIILPNVKCSHAEKEIIFPEGMSHSVNLDLIPEIAKTNPKNAIGMIVAYLKLKEFLEEVEK